MLYSLKQVLPIKITHHDVKLVVLVSPEDYSQIF